MNTGIEQTQFEKELEELINKHSIENGSDTPDFILMQYLIQCLNTWNWAVRKRDTWFGFKPMDLSTRISEDKK